MFLTLPRTLNQAFIWKIPLFSLVLAMTIHLLQLNQPIFQLINSQATSLLDPSAWEMITILGDGLVVLTLLLPLHRRYPQLTTTALLSGLMAALWVHLLKMVLGVPRPPAVIDIQVINIIGPAFKHGSFPSGHSATMFALLGTLVLWMKDAMLRQLFPIILLLGLLAAISRSVVGIHWPIDILIGMVIGWLSAILTVQLTKHTSIGDITKDWIGRLLLLCTLYLLLVHDTGYPNAKAFQHVIAITVLGVVSMDYLKTDAKD
jgi:membrane-associated phospholipid phosphatase